MASTAAGGSTSYGGGSGGGGGAGGKYPKAKRPFNGSARPPPYARPAALQNPSTTNGWLSKLVVDPASKLISASAHLFFSSSLFRKRLPPASPPPHIPPPPGSNSRTRTCICRYSYTSTRTVYRLLFFELHSGFCCDGNLVLWLSVFLRAG